MNLVCPTETGEKYTYQKCRALAADYMRAHPDEFIHYLPGQDDGLDGGLMTGAEYAAHCDRIRDSACWGGEPEVRIALFFFLFFLFVSRDADTRSQILALSKALQFPIHVVQAFHPPIKVSDEFLPRRGNIALTISYHRKSYGLGEHYNCMPLSALPSSLSAEDPGPLTHLSAFFLGLCRLAARLLSKALRPIS
jgi:OTU domain-containing protein 6